MGTVWRECQPARDGKHAALPQDAYLFAASRALPPASGVFVACRCHGASRSKGQFVRALFSRLGICCDNGADRLGPSLFLAHLGLNGGRRALGGGWGGLPRRTSMTLSVDDRAVLHIPTTTHALAPTKLISNFDTGSHTLPFHEHSISIPTSIPDPSHHGGPGHFSRVHLRRASPSRRSSLLSTLRDAYSPYPQWWSLWRLAVQLSHAVRRDCSCSRTAAAQGCYCCLPNFGRSRRCQEG